MAVELARVGVHGEDAVIVCEQRAICTEVHPVWLNADAVHYLRFLGPVVRRLDPRVNHLSPEAESSIRTDADADLADLPLGGGDQVFGVRLLCRLPSLHDLSSCHRF